MTYVQSVIGTLLYYARDLDCTMRSALNQIGSQQIQPTIKVKQKFQRLLDYTNTYPDKYVSIQAKCN